MCDVYNKLLLDKNEDYILATLIGNINKELFR